MFTRIIYDPSIACFFNAVILFALVKITDV